jgi:hypothetical protein
LTKEVDNLVKNIFFGNYYLQKKVDFKRQLVDDEEIQTFKFAMTIITTATVWTENQSSGIGSKLIFNAIHGGNDSKKATFYHLP